MADGISFMPSTRLLVLYRDKRLSPVEVTEDPLRCLEEAAGPAWPSAERSRSLD